MSYNVGIRVPFGMQPCGGLVGFPEGRKRIRQRNDKAARVYVKTESGIREFIPELGEGGVWLCDYRLEQGSNQREVECDCLGSPS